MGESDSTIDETIDLIRIIKPYSSGGAYLLWLLPGTQTYKEAVAKGKFNQNYWSENENAIPINLQEHTLDELNGLRERLMWGIAREKGDIIPKLSYFARSLLYKHEGLARFRHLVPEKLR